MMKNQSYFSHLRCSKCGKKYDPDRVQSFCPDCTRPLLAEYDLVSARRDLSRKSFEGRMPTMWRYRELLPVKSDDALVTLGEGWTPLIHLERLGASLGAQNLYVKDESTNPTESFKARGLCVAVSKAKELGLKELAVPSAGNAGGALAAYAAKAGMAAHVFVPRDTPVVNRSEVLMFGANLYLVDGVISDAAKKMNEMKVGTSWFDVSTMKEPYRLEGKKTIGYELAEQFAWNLPDAILYPTGGGTGLLGMWKAFAEMEALGWISAKRPKMVVVQSTGCAPVVRAFKQGKRSTEFWEKSSTLASGLRVPRAFADEMILSAVYESGGTALAVSDDDILSAMKQTAAEEGMLLCPEGAATVVAVRQLIGDGFLKKSDRVLAFNTGSGYKYVEVLEKIGMADVQLPTRQNE